MAPPRWTVERYMRLVDEGVLSADDRVELLEGVIVGMAPQNVLHAAGVTRVGHALPLVVRERALVRVQLPLHLGRLTKSAIYAAARVPEYWIVKIPDDCVEVRRDPVPGERRYQQVRIARRGEELDVQELPGVHVVVGDLLPAPCSGSSST